MADAPDVDEQSVAEILPELYRQVLDRVTSLEQSGYRAEAGLVRAKATEIYSAAWTVAAVTRLRGLRIHAERVIAGRVRPHASRPWAAAFSKINLVRSA